MKMTKKFKIVMKEKVYYQNVMIIILLKIFIFLLFHICSIFTNKKIIIY